MPLPRDEEREERISYEIIVDAYGPEEQALGWYYYLKDNLDFPFRARCVRSRSRSPLEPGDEFDVVGMPSEEVCEREMVVNIRWKQQHTLAVPLDQIEGIGVDKQTRQAIEDLHYWVEQGHMF